MSGCSRHRQTHQRCLPGRARSNSVQLSNGSVLTVLQAPRFHRNPQAPHPTGTDSVPRGPALTPGNLHRLRPAARIQSHFPKQNPIKTDPRATG
jgi:hypothetical protein